MSIDFDGRVAIITGAGRGIGRETALTLARRGARIVVNDYGGGASTVKPGSIDVAQSVVEEIKTLGGEAVAEGSSVGTSKSAEAIAGCAMEAFGRADILVNNAGGNITTDIDALTDARAEAILRSNFTGGYMLLRKLWPVMRERGFGRIVNIMSGALLGMPGRAPYAAGKAAYLGLTTVAAIEGEPHGICVNGIWPTANTRLAGSLEDEAMKRWLEDYPPHLVAEAIAYFCAPQCRTTGEFYSVGGGSVARLGFASANGFADPEMTAERLAENIEQARDMTSAQPMEPAGGG